MQHSIIDSMTSDSVKADQNENVLKTNEQENLDHTKPKPQDNEKLGEQVNLELNKTAIQEDIKLINKEEGLNIDSSNNKKIELTENESSDQLGESVLVNEKASVEAASMKSKILDVGEIDSSAIVLENNCSAETELLENITSNLIAESLPNSLSKDVLPNPQLDVNPVNKFESKILPEDITASQPSPILLAEDIVVEQSKAKLILEEDPANQPEPKSLPSDLNIIIKEYDMELDLDREEALSFTDPLSPRSPSTPMRMYSSPYFPNKILEPEIVDPVKKVDAENPDKNERANGLDSEIEKKEVEIKTDLKDFSDLALSYESKPLPIPNKPLPIPNKPLPIPNKPLPIPTEPEEQDRAYLIHLRYEIPQQLYIPLQQIIYKAIKLKKDRWLGFGDRLVDIESKEMFVKEVNCWGTKVLDKAATLFGIEGMVIEEDILAFDIDINMLLMPFQTDRDLGLAILVQLLVTLIDNGTYHSYTRNLLVELANKFGISYKDLCLLLEFPLAKDLVSARGKIPEMEKERVDRNQQTWSSRWAWTGLGALGGGVALAVTGGLAAPVVLPYLGMALGGAAGLAGLSSLAMVTSLFGATGAGLVGYRTSRRFGTLESIQFLALPAATSDPHLHTTICVSGWLDQLDSVTVPWSTLREGEGFALEFEPEILVTIGKALTSTFASGAISLAANEMLKKTALAGLMSAMAWPLTILQAGSMIDNPWSLGLDRAEKAGLVLADALINRAHGNRPVSLIGYSLGSRVVFACLEELVRRASTDPTLFTLLENVYLIGSPVTVNLNRWSAIRPLVSNRIVNAYLPTDWVLSFLHRSLSFGQPVAGLVDLKKLWQTSIDDGDRNGPASDTEVENENDELDLEDSFDDMDLEENDQSHCSLPDIECINLAGIVEGHLDYPNYMEAIMQKLGLIIEPSTEKAENIILFDDTL